MTTEQRSLEERVHELERQVGALNERLEVLTRGQEKASPVESQAAALRSSSAPPEDPSEELMNWVGRSSLLPRLSTLCFLLVVALALRTITDNDIIDKQVGSLIGMTYAAALMFAGWFQYGNRTPLAPIFTISGAVLMFIIIGETHARFDSLPSVAAYIMVIGTGVAMAIISFRNRNALPILVGTFGMCLAGVSIDYPHPYYPSLAFLLFSANVLGFFASRLKKCSWLRWILLIVTILLLEVWGLKIGAKIGKGAGPQPALAMGWFSPAVIAFSVAFLASSLVGILRAGTEKISRFDFSLPTINVVWGFAAFYYLVQSLGGNLTLVGVLGVLIASAHLGVGFWLARRDVPGAPGTNAFAFAASVLLALSLPVASGSLLLALPLLSAAALGLVMLSRMWRSGGVRLTSYLLQLFAAVALGKTIWGNEAALPLIVTLVAAGLVAAIALGHFLWCQANRPPAQSVVFSKMDGEDPLAILLFLASLASVFFMARFGAFHALSQVPPEQFSSAFTCTQSVIINLSATGLMVLAFARRSKELRNVAVIVGLPLVVSVFSFGLAASLESFALTRWQRIEALRVSRWPKKSAHDPVEEG